MFWHFIFSKQDCLGEYFPSLCPLLHLGISQVHIYSSASVRLFNQIVWFLICLFISLSLKVVQTLQRPLKGIIQVVNIYKIIFIHVTHIFAPSPGELICVILCPFWCAVSSIAPHQIFTYAFGITQRITSLNKTFYSFYSLL